MRKEGLRQEKDRGQINSDQPLEFSKFYIFNWTRRDDTGIVYQYIYPRKPSHRFTCHLKDVRGIGKINIHEGGGIIALGKIADRTFAGVTAMSQMTT